MKDSGQHVVSSGLVASSCVEYTNRNAVLYAVCAHMYLHVATHNLPVYIIHALCIRASGAWRSLHLWLLSCACVRCRQKSSVFIEGEQPKKYHDAFAPAN